VFNDRRCSWEEAVYDTLPEYVKKWRVRNQAVEERRKISPSTCERVEKLEYTPETAIALQKRKLGLAGVR
jgi:hypothetical protein